MITPRFRAHTMFKLSITLFLVFMVSACAPVSDSDPVREYRTQIRWTSYGIPHVKADDWASLGYGFAYATATDGFCVIADSVMTSGGELSRNKGPENGNLQRELRRAKDQWVREMVDGARPNDWGFIQKLHKLADNIRRRQEPFTEAQWADYLV